MRGSGRFAWSCEVLLCLEHAGVQGLALAAVAMALAEEAGA